MQGGAGEESESYFLYVERTKPATTPQMDPYPRPAHQSSTNHSSGESARATSRARRRAQMQGGAGEESESYFLYVERTKPATTQQMGPYPASGPPIEQQRQKKGRPPVKATSLVSINLSVDQLMFQQ
jgi:hypothetical protein